MRDKHATRPLRTVCRWARRHPPGAVAHRPSAGEHRFWTRPRRRPRRRALLHRITTQRRRRGPLLAFSYHSCLHLRTYILCGGHTFHSLRHPPPCGQKRSTTTAATHIHTIRRPNAILCVVFVSFLDAHAPLFRGRDAIRSYVLLTLAAIAPRRHDCARSRRRRGCNPT